MSFVDAFAPDMVLGPDQVLPTAPRDFGERFDLNWKAARAPDKFFFYESRMTALWDEALDRLNKATGQTFPNPFRLPAGKRRTHGLFGEELPKELGAPRRDDVLPDILAAFDQALAGQHDLPNPRLFEDKIREEATKMRQDAAKSALASYGAGGLGAFLGAAAGEISHPVNLATLPLGGSYALANIARVGLLRYLGRNALAEAGVAMASQTAIEALDAPYQERLATDTGLADRLERIFIAGAGGAILGLGLSGLVAAARGLRRKLPATLDEADALKVAERATLHEGKNPLGSEGGVAHGEALRRAEADVAAGRHANVDEIVREEVKRQVRAAQPLTRPESYPENVKEALGRFATGPADPMKAGDEAILIAAARANRLPEERVVYRGFNEKFGPLNPEQRLVSTSDLEGGKSFATERNQAKIDDALAEGDTFAASVAEIRLPVGTGVLEPSSFGRQSKRETEIAFLLEGRLIEDGPARIVRDGEFTYRIQPYRIEPEAAAASPASDILSPTPASLIAESAPIPPEKAAATAKAEAELFNARSIAEDPNAPKAEIKITEDGRAMSPKEALEAADEEAKMARQIQSCAKGFVL